jgi:DNA (cytosine-5)-methyltransferase 1
MSAIEFISRHLASKNHFLGEIVGDCKRLSLLLGFDDLGMELSNLSKDWNCFINDKNQREKLSKAITQLSSQTDLARKFMSRSVEKNRHDHQFIDLFAGCGGLSHGLSAVGFKPLLINEIDESAALTHFLNSTIEPEKYFVGDVRKLQTNVCNLEKLKGLDLVCGGPPCQGFSTANRQRLIDDPRNKLYTHFIKIVGIVRPKVILIENVRGMATRADEIIEDIRRSAGSDYNADYTFLDANDYGVPQRRVRFFLIATRLPVNATEIFSDIEKNSHQFVLGDALSSLPRVTPKTEPRRSSLENAAHGYRIASKLNIEKNRFLSNLNKSTETEWVLNHVCRYNNSRDIQIFKKLPQGADSLHESISDIMPYKNRNHIFKDKYYKLKENAPCKTITSHMRFDCNMYIHPRQARGLTAREAARVQTFPDNYLFVGRPNTWYTQIGNAVPVAMATAIGKSISKCLREHSE